ncbi:hypothetical protein CRG98_006879 [Punica granatum]|uniref:Uncharacterized protein n=1 Tax=Punica granatum TaxID=22663 RepID=A0A2I0KW83_PUNGR|nr:hypothetical protein CRG98_006879 [Punica granatum]
MISGDSFSHACPSRVPTGRWTLPSHAIQKCACGPRRESTFGSVHHRRKRDGCGGRWWWKGDGRWVGRGRVRRWRCGGISVFRNLGWRNLRRWAGRWSLSRSASMRAWSSEADDVNETRRRGAPEDVGGWRCVGGAPEYTGSMPAGVGGGGACVGGG